MKRSAILVYFLLFSCFICGCASNLYDDTPNYSPKFVVEGWIENDDYPVVLLTHNAPFFSTLDSATLKELMIRWAKVTVSDGEKTEVLTGKINNNYFPPFIYQGNELKGEIGKRYALTVEYAGITLKSETTIPAPVEFDDVWFEAVPNIDTVAQLNVKFTDNAAEKNYYRISTLIKSTNKKFIPTLRSAMDDHYFNGKSTRIQINRGPDSYLQNKTQVFYPIGDTVFVKLSTLPEKGYLFWNKYHEQQLNKGNPFAGSVADIPTNIEGPALGIWCGYGSSVYQLIAKPLNK
ncbi:hypothetical protein D3C72_516730 [compost metagenome]